MPVVISIVAIIIIFVFVYILFIRPAIAKKEINKRIEAYFEKLEYHNGSKNRLYDKLLIKDDEKIYFKYVIVPSNSQITINCKEIWRLSWGGNSEKIGRAYPNNRYLKEVESFAKAKLDGKKIFIIYYTTEHILRYVNECELETIDITKKTYDYKLICFDKFEEEMDYCINK